MNVSINSRDPAGRISGNLTQYRKDFSERKSMNSMVKVKGTPYEQGVMQGTELREVILHNIREVGKKMASDHVDMVRYEEFVKKNAAFLKQAHSDIFEEMKGISDGAEIPFDDILMLNIPAYFMTGYFNQECSMIMARGKATADGCTYVIKNRDMSTYIEQAVIEREYPDGLKIVEINGAGTVTYPASGMNSYGVGVTTTGFWSAKAPSDLEAAEYSHIFLNVHLLLAYHAHNPGNYLVGEDISRTCCMMTVCNMLVHGCVGEVICHDSLQPKAFTDGWKVNQALPLTGIPSIRRMKEEEYRNPLPENIGRFKEAVRIINLLDK